MNITTRKGEVDNFKIKIIHFVIDSNDKSVVEYSYTKVQKIIVIISERTAFQQKRG